MSLELDMLHDRNLWKARCAKAEACAAEMRAACLAVKNWFGLSDDGSTLSVQVDHALSSDCGKDFVPRAELDERDAVIAEMREVLKDCTSQINDEGRIVCSGCGAPQSCSCDYGCKVKHALSTDCGIGWLSPERANQLITSAFKEFWSGVEARHSLRPWSIDVQELERKLLAAVKVEQK